MSKKDLTNDIHFCINKAEIYLRAGMWKNYQFWIDKRDGLIKKAENNERIKTTRTRRTIRW